MSGGRRAAPGDKGNRAGGVAQCAGEVEPLDSARGFKVSPDRVLQGEALRDGRRAHRRTPRGPRTVGENGRPLRSGRELVKL